MTTQIFPALAGLGFDTPRMPMWSTSKPQSVAGLEAVFSYWSVPRYQWTLQYNFLRADPTNQELQQLMGFFNNRKGGAEIFLYQDPVDYTVAAQPLGLGTGSKASFQLIASFGGFSMPILAPQNVSEVTIDGTPVDPSDYTVSYFDSTTPGVITFDTPPSNGAAIAATFTYYFPCRFINDSMNFNLFLTELYDAKGVAFRSIKSTQ